MGQETLIVIYHIYKFINMMAVSYIYSSHGGHNNGQSQKIIKWKDFAQRN
ncbi:hypothetical protein ENROMA047B_19825 [Enterobacter rongchengensis]